MSSLLAVFMKAQRLPNKAVERPAVSHSLAAAADCERWQTIDVLGGEMS